MVGDPRVGRIGIGLAHGGREPRGLIGIMGSDQPAIVGALGEHQQGNQCKYCTGCDGGAGKAIRNARAYSERSQKLEHGRDSDQGVAAGSAGLDTMPRPKISTEPETGTFAKNGNCTCSCSVDGAEDWMMLVG